MELRIIVTLTTIPKRIQHLEATLHTLLKQSLLPNKIYIELARNKSYILPPILQNITSSSLIDISWLDADYSPVCKLLGGWFAEKANRDRNKSLGVKSRTVYITVDDDIKYHYRYPEAAVSLGGSSILSHPPFVKMEKFNFAETTNIQRVFSFPRKAEVDWLQGVSGALYPEWLLTDSMIDKLIELSGKYKHMFRSDDAT